MKQNQGQKNMDSVLIRDPPKRKSGWWIVISTLTKGKYMLKKIVLLWIMAIGLVFLSVPMASAIPLVGGGYEGLYFNNSETFINTDNSYDPTTGNPTVTTGDIFWGIYNLQNIKAPTDPSGSIGPEIWSSGAGQPQEITGYFVSQIVNVIPGGGPGGVTDLLVFGPSSYDPNGILDTTKGEVFRIYEDTTKNYNDSTQALGLATATDGKLVWSFGMGPSTDGDSTGGYWYSFAPQVIPNTLYQQIGTSYAGFNFDPITVGSNTTPDGTNFIAINDPNENIANQNVELWFNSEILQVYNIGDTDANGNALFEFSSNDPAVLYPVPEPTTMLLFGSGLIGLVGLGRKKLGKQKKA